MILQDLNVTMNEWRLTAKRNFIPQVSRSLFESQHSCMQKRLMLYNPMVNSYLLQKSNEISWIILSKVAHHLFETASTFFSHTGRYTRYYISFVIYTLYKLIMNELLWNILRALFSYSLRMTVSQFSNFSLFYIVFFTSNAEVFLYNFDWKFLKGFWSVSKVK